MNATETPAVSVIIPAYRASRFIAETLDSVLGQTFKDHEIILVNDGSPDTEELERAIEPYRRFVTYLTQENRGPAAARNAAIRRARGYYLAFLDADDQWLPIFLSSQLELLRRENLDLVYADLAFFGDGLPPEHSFMEKNPSRQPVTIDTLISEECVVLTPTVVVRKEAVLEAGAFDERLRRSEDFDLWTRIALRGRRLSFQREVLGRRRIHGEALTAQSIPLSESIIVVHQKILENPSLPTRLVGVVEARIAFYRQSIEWELGKAALLAADYQQARQRIGRVYQATGRRSARLLLVALRIAAPFVRWFARVRAQRQRQALRREV
jgi:cellulose synthase/poly-beta-1,6-N-acetylglucosamine synthase-like glycosyltransferase